MDKTISIAEAAKILDVTMPTVSYYIRQKRLRFELSNQRTTGRRQKRVVYLADVEKLQSELRPPDTTDAGE
jgi:predicted transcriptional regulator